MLAHVGSFLGSKCKQRLGDGCAATSEAGGNVFCLLRSELRVLRASL